MNFTIKEKIEILEDFVGGRYISDNTMALYENRFDKIEETLYRGMPFYREFIKPGYIIKEWYGASHWSLDFDIARNKFAKNYIEDEYIEDLAIELGKSFDDVYEAFVPIVLRINGFSRGARTYEMVKDLGI